MKYYTIQNNSILIADNEQALKRFYNNVLPLPEDYEQGKYIIQDGELVKNPDYETEKAQAEKDKQIVELKKQLEITDLKRIRAVCENEPKDEHTTWLEYYNSVIIDLRQQLSKLLG